MEKLDKAEEELNKSRQSAVSLTDPEARFMEKKKRRKELSYNSQKWSTKSVRRLLSGPSVILSII